MEGILFSSSLWVVRYLYNFFSIPFGTHTIILVILLILFHRFLSGVNWGIAVAASLIGMILVLLGGTVSQLLVKGLGLTGEQILGNPWLHVLMGSIENVFLFIAFIVIKFFKFNVIKSLDLSE